eukprot:15456770-Alexandrium_andersonii.AAC.1
MKGVHERTVRGFITCSGAVPPRGAIMVRSACARLRVGTCVLARARCVRALAFAGAALSVRARVRAPGRVRMCVHAR